MQPLQLSPAGRRYGYLRDEPDERDLPVHAEMFHLSGDALPSSFSLESFCGPVRDQGDEGSCTAHAGVGMREFLARKLQSQAPILSPAFLYYQERLLDGSLDQGDCGSYGRTACRAINQFGIVELGEEPYVPGDFSTPPSILQLADALKWKGGAYHRITSVEDMKSCLSSYVFAIGFTVYESFEHVGSDGIWTPSTDEGVLGGHETLVIGYDDTVNGGSFLVRNSWGSGWGLGGNFWLRYSDAGNPDILQDAWMIHLGPPWRAKSVEPQSPSDSAT